MKNSLRSHPALITVMYVQSWIVFLFIVHTAFGHFGYSKHQHKWAQKFKLCAGKWQSPIALSSAKSVLLPLPAVEMIGYRNYLPGQVKVINNGHSISLSVNKGLSKRLPYVFGAMLNKDQEYEFEGLHFHWGAKNSRGSEHILNGVRFPMEMHIIHRNMMYPNLSRALEHEDGLTVLAVFFQVQEDDNRNLNPLLRILSNIQWINNEVYMNVSITLASLMPCNLEIFYTYRGSLTTPPCSEAVTWIVFPTPVSISFRQINKFRSLSSGEDILVDNYRHLQNIGKRKVYIRKLKSSFASKLDMINLNVTSLQWYWQ